MTQATIDRYVVLGNPVAHSQSPFIHTEFARQTGQILEYGRQLCALDGFEQGLRVLADAGVLGCSVTVPFKFEAYRLASSRSARAELAQAANAMRRDGRGWAADNTDGIGLVSDIQHNAGVELAGARVLLIGAGGAAAGVLGPLIEAGPNELVLVNRHTDKAEALALRHATLAQAQHCVLAVAEIARPGEAFDVVINATSSSLQGGAVPVPAGVLRGGALAVDLMYGPAAAGFIRWAESHDARARDGLGMLVEQAAIAFHFWRGVMPDTAPVLRALRERL